MFSICHVLGLLYLALLGQAFVMSSVCYVLGLLYLVFVMPNVCLFRVGYRSDKITIKNIYISIMFFRYSNSNCGQLIKGYQYFVIENRYGLYPNDVLYNSSF